MSTSEWIGFAGVCVTVLASGGAIWSAYISHQQWKKIKDKIGYITDSNKASKILPAWYTGRMMSDKWVFGLLLTDNRVAVISRIKGITDDGKWVDVELHTEGFSHLAGGYAYMYAISESRDIATIQVSHIIGAFELADS